ncbi:FAD-dependent monooxygenase [Streptomyces cyanogenus]|uniref:Pentachlorophenol 4-monooxygenase n=1 Tax=Streptomyces cyanogenus TaxID=80860 RepID=A0ABX7TMP2_STRCY|nr:FAD-dependent monooxygenase [Streptomyces cyanogenus]QTD96721.1 Pentachlorophenol 4-monooxygenase [Streptomyces cyanogenus]
MSNPIVIAGGGPVGLMLAYELGLAGVDTVVLERRDQPSTRSRGMAVNATVVELLTQRGLMETLQGDGFTFPAAHFAHLWLDPTRLPESRAFAFAVAHSQLERRLEEQAVKLGVSVRRGAEVVGIDQDESGVLVTVRTGSGEETVRASYVVGCDGADSSVRTLAGIDFVGTDNEFRGIVGDVEVATDDPLFAKLGVNQTDTGFFTVSPVGPDVLRVATGEFGAGTVAEDVPVDRAELDEAIRRITGDVSTSGTARWLARWNPPTRQAIAYRSGRVFLAGDAAHVHFPLGGQALSTGIEDAVNLGWKLAAHLQGRAAQSLLDTYHEERHPVGERACLTTRAQLALLHPMKQVSPLRTVLTELFHIPEVNAHFVRMVGGLDVQYPFRYAQLPETVAAHALQGSRLGDVPLTAGEPTSLGRLLHGGRGVLVDFTTSGAHSGQAGHWAGRVDVVAAEAAAEIDATALLLRPDGRIAWATSDDTATESSAAGLDAALRTWFGTPVG